MIDKAQIKALIKEMLADLKRSGLDARDAKKLGIQPKAAPYMREHFGVSAKGFLIHYDKTYARAKLLEAVPGREKMKYSQMKGTSPRLYCPEIGEFKWKKVYRDVSIPLYVTEGEKKAAAACKARYACVGLGGVSCFRSKETGFLPDWDKFNFKGRSVFIVFDSDIIDKPQVRYAEFGLALELEARGAIVKRVRLSQSGDNKVGLDDFLVQHGYPKNTKAARKAFDALPREDIIPTYAPHLTELGNALRLVEYFSDELRYVPQFRDWAYHDKKSGLWLPDQDGGAMRCAKQLPYMLRREADKVKNAEMRKSYLTWAARSESERSLNATLKLASSESSLVMPADRFDEDQWSLAMRNGMVIDLRTMKKRQITSEDYLTKAIGTLYDPKADCPRWKRFIYEIMQGDGDAIQFLQRAVGWSLTGDMSEQRLFVLSGTGANGKSTFSSALLALLGAYGKQAAPESFMVQKSPSPTRSDLVRLVGVRFISTSESEDGQRFAEALIKQWTGGEAIVVRDLYKKTFEFQPQGKIWLATNHKPKVFGMDEAIWRRLLLIEFGRTFQPKERDPKLGEKLLAELPGILNWALEGCRQWQHGGLCPPKSVIAATQAYREDMDMLGTWISENCENGASYRDKLSDLFRDYKSWASNTHEHTFHQRDFAKHMKERGFGKKQTTERGSKKKGWFLLGIRLKDKPKDWMPEPVA